MSVFDQTMLSLLLFTLIGAIAILVTQRDRLQRRLDATNEAQRFVIKNFVDPGLASKLTAALCRDIARRTGDETLDRSV